MSLFARLACASVLSVLAVNVSPPAGAGAPPPSGPVPSSADARPVLAACVDRSVPLTAEEDLLSRPEPARFVEAGGFADALRAFDRDICAAGSLREARAVVRDHARALWRSAVARAHGGESAGATLDGGDDRPLYWTRLAMAATLRQWRPAFDLGAADRTALIAVLDRVSRGQDDIRFPRSERVRKVLVTGFDPFQLSRNIRQGNPSGATALALDGLTVKGPDGPIRLEAALFPVRWRDFGDGMVEQTLLPHLTGRAAVDAFVTTSQGRTGRIDVEHFNGAWRGGSADNEGVCYRGVAPIAPHLPTILPQPQWTTTTLPVDALLDARTAPFPVYDNRTVVEVAGDTPAQAATTDCPAAYSFGTTRRDGPTDGSQARSGGGGNYLSNEVAYRATLLRDALRLDVPGGHVHTPVLTGLGSDPEDLSTPAFEANRETIVAQVRDLVMIVARSAGR